jgi:predicted O-methyltransferase YrrM
MLGMSLSGTDSYEQAQDLPPLVAAAVGLSVRRGFAYSCRVEQGRLLYALAAGASSSIGESGTGCGVGLAWLVSAAGTDVRIVSVERDHERAAQAASLFVDYPNVTVRCGDWTLLEQHGPFDLLVLDGGGNGKSGASADPAALLCPGGTVVIDDFSPCDDWPPMHEGSLDQPRLHWLQHPEIRAVEVRLAPDLVTVLGTRRRAGEPSQP